MRNKLFLVVIGIVFLLGFFIVSSLFQGEEVERVANIHNEEYFLFLGLDDFGEVRRTDTIMVAKLEDEGAKLISIPRDLRVKFPDRTFQKINAAYGAPNGGIELVKRVVSDLLGVEINAYLVADYQGVVELVDAIGGVPLNIDNPMQYTDTKQNLVINLTAGQQVLNGDQAVQFLRYRNETGDLGRISRQQEFLGSLGEKLANTNSVDQVTKLIPTAMQHVKTNLTALQLRDIAQKTQNFTPQDVSFRTLPGHAETIDGVNYFVESPIEVAAMVDEYFKGIERTTNSDVKVIVVDGRGGGTLGAQPIFSYLESQSFDALAYYHADARDYPKSYVIDLSGAETLSNSPNRDKLERLMGTLRSSVRAQWGEQEMERRLLLRLAGEEGLSQVESMTANQKADRLFDLSFEAQTISEFKAGFGAEFAPEEGNIRYKPTRYGEVAANDAFVVEDRFDMIADMLINFGDPEPNGPIDLMEADLLLIIGEGFPIE